MITFDRSPMQDSKGNYQGRVFDRAFTMWDGRTYDSTGALLLGELERLDQTPHPPLFETSWGRDIDLREDVTIADEISSWTLSTFGGVGGLGTGNGIGNGKSWIGKNTSEIPGVSVDLAKMYGPLRLWGEELSYTIPELESALRLGRPIDQAKYNAIQVKHEMDIDEQVYIGDTSTGDTGLINKVGINGQASVTATNLAPGGGGQTQWVTKSPDEILNDVNTMLTTTWAASGWKFPPNRLLIPPAQFGYIATAKVSNAGNVSILKYIMDNNILTGKQDGRQLVIADLKWCIGAGVGGILGTAGNFDRAVAYTKNKDLVRFPMTTLQKTPIQYDSIYHKTTYFGRLGVVEFVYPESASYYDGI